MFQKEPKIIQPVIILIPKGAIDNKYTDGVFKIINDFIPLLLERNRNRIRLEVLGYNNDHRELFDIPEVRVYFKELIERIPEFFYWIDIKSYMFIFMGLMIYRPCRINGQVGLEPQDLQAYLLKGFIGLNIFCEKHGLSPEPTNDLIKYTLYT
jgi:hypothetical protein